MPMYEYRCRSCGERTELLQHLGEPRLTVCPRCGGVVDKMASAPALQFKGSGWYVTDYARGGAPDRSKELAAKKDSASSKSNSGSSSKSDSGSSSKSDSAGSSKTDSGSSSKSDSGSSSKSAEKPASTPSEQKKAS